MLNIWKVLPFNLQYQFNKIIIIIVITMMNNTDDDQENWQKWQFNKSLTEFLFPESHFGVRPDPYFSIIYLYGGVIWSQGIGQMG